MNIEQQNVSVELDEVIDFDCYFVRFVAEITNTKGVRYDIKYQRSHENGPDYRETIRQVVERAVVQYSEVTAYCAQKFGIILKELDIKTQ